MPPQVQQALLDTRKQHPTWGPKKLLPYLAKRQPELALPAASAVGDLLERQGLTQPKRRRRTHQHPGAVSLVADTPNTVWSTDFKGQVRTGDGEYCFPLTVTDNHSRFLLGCHVFAGLPRFVLGGAGGRFPGLHTPLSRIWTARCHSHRQRQSVRC